MSNNYLCFEVMPHHTKSWVLGARICPPYLMQKTHDATIKNNPTLTWMQRPALLTSSPTHPRQGLSW